MTKLFCKTTKIRICFALKIEVYKDNERIARESGKPERWCVAGIPVRNM